MTAPAAALDDALDDDADEPPPSPLEQAEIDDITHFAEQQAQMDAEEERTDPSYTPSTTEEAKRGHSTRRRTASKAKKTVVIEDDEDDEVGTVHALAYLSLTSA